MDLSNYTKDLTDQGCADLLAAGVVGCIIQAVTGVNGVSYTRQQLDACQRNGLRIQGYVWVFPGDTKPSMGSRLAMFNGFPIEALYVDVEQMGVKEADVDRDLAAADAYLADGRLAGIYSSRYVFVDNKWLGVTKWANAGRLLWSAIYDGIADPDVGFVPYAGWGQCQIKQFGGSSSLGSVTEIDLDISR